MYRTAVPAIPARMLTATGYDSVSRRLARFESVVHHKVEHREV